MDQSVFDIGLNVVDPKGVLTMSELEINPYEPDASVREICP